MEASGLSIVEQTPVIPPSPAHVYAHECAEGKGINYMLKPHFSWQGLSERGAVLTHCFYSGGTGVPPQFFSSLQGVHRSKKIGDR